MNGDVTTGWPLTSGIWGDETLPGHGPLLLERGAAGYHPPKRERGAMPILTRTPATRF